MLDKIRGEVTYILRDAVTEEIIAEHTQENIVTEVLYSKLGSGWNLSGNIAVTNAVMEPSRFTPIPPGNGSGGTVTTFPSRVIPAVGNTMTFVAASGSTAQYIQYSGRYDAPAIGTSRVINSVCLIGKFNDSAVPSSQGSLAYNYYSYSDDPYVMAYLKLATTCTQTDTQVLDVYYRLFLPYTTAVANIPSWMYTNNAQLWAAQYASGISKARNFPFRLPMAKTGDEELSLVPYKSIFSVTQTGTYTVSIGTSIGGSPNVPGGYGFSTTDANFTDNPGIMVGSLVYWTSYPSFYVNMGKTNKIQNLIGTAQELTNPIAPAFLDVDNLPTGTGKVYLGGTWNNIGSPSGTGLYYPSIISEYNRIKITTSGAIGVSQYKIVRQKFFGYMPRLTGAPNIGSNYRYKLHILPPMTASTQGTALDLNKNLMEDTTETTFSTQQMSACCRYDDSSFIFVKKNKIILYSVGAGDYWKYNGSYTNIHQVAVMNNKIYVACRSTGLWVIDPYNSLTPSSLASPGGGIDLSACHGVAKGNGNTVWAVGANCLAKFDGSTWTKYDSTTTPAFTMAGVSDSNWSNIDYLKVDEDSATNQMMLVRKYDATSNPTLLGVWWSTAGTTINTGAEPAATSTTIGRPRIHRGHVGGLGGYWLVLAAGQWRYTTFGSSSFTAHANLTAYATGTPGTSYNTPSYWAWWFQSAIFVKTQAGLIRSWHCDSMANVGSGSYSVMHQWNQKTVDSTGTLQENYTTSTSGIVIGYYELGYHEPSNSQPGTAGYPKTSTQGTYSGQGDMAHCFALAPGVLVHILYEQGFPGGDGAAQFLNIVTRVGNFGLDYTQSGGSMNYVAQVEYGWDGSQWVVGAAGGRPTHTSTQPLFDGVTVRFEEGATPTSFVTPNVYKFGLVDGILKDNATKATYSGTPYYLRKATSGLTDLEFSTVPASRTGSTGIIGIDTYNKSSNAALNANNEVVFPGQNAKQYAVGSVPLVGDFVISIDPTNFSATNINYSSSFGVTKADIWNSGLMYIGYYFTRGTLYWNDPGVTQGTVTIAGTTSLEIRRTSGTFSYYRNGVLLRTVTATGIRTADYVLDYISVIGYFGNYSEKDTTYLPSTGSRSPKATVTSNGSAIYINMGNSVTRTGRYSDRFYGIDINQTTVVLGGVAVTPKTDGTVPAAGEVTIDVWRGVLYFNSADIGKTITANYTILNS